MDATKVHQTPSPYSLDGSGEPTILFIHGFLDAGAVWDKVRARLKDAGLATAALDLPGMGGASADPETISLDRYAGDVGSVIEAIGGKIVLVGQSMGAQVAELVAVRHSDQIAGLVLLAPVPLGGVGAPEEAIAPMKSAGGKPEAQRGLRKNLSFNLDPTSLDMLTTLGVAVDPAVVARLVDVWNTGHRDGQSPSRYSGPVLILRGAADPFVDDALAERTITRFAAARLAKVAQAGHWAHIEVPGVVAELIARFVDTLATAVDAEHAMASGSGASDWKGAFAERSASAFANACAEDVVLEASALRQPVRGLNQVKSVMAAASAVYAELEFTTQVVAESRQYLEWIARGHDDVAYRGVTVLTRNPAGAIAHIAIHHRPLDAAMQFSRALGSALAGTIDPAHFLAVDEHKTT